MSIKVNPQKKYRQTKLSLRLGKSIDLTFHLNNQGEAHFFQQSVKDEVYLFQVKWPEMDQLLNITCDKKHFKLLNQPLFHQIKYPLLINLKKI